MAAFDGSGDNKRQAPPVDAAAGAPDLVDQAVKAELTRRRQDMSNRSWLSSAVHTVSDGLTHAFGGGNSDQTAAALERLQSQYHQDLVQGRNTEALKTEIYTTIAKDKAAQSREDTNAGYGSEFLKAAALFAPRSISPFATGVVTAFDQTNNLSSGSGIAEFGLGFGKGFALSKLYSHIGSKNWSAPMQGIALGATSRALDIATDLNTYKDQRGNWSLGAIGQHLG